MSPSGRKQRITVERGAFLVALLNGQGLADDAVVRAVVAKGKGLAPIILVENNAERAAIFKFDPFVEMAFGAQGVEGTGDGAGVLAQLGGFPFEAVYFFEHLNGNEDGVALEGEQRVWIVQQDIGVKNVIFHWGDRPFLDWTCARTIHSNYCGQRAIDNGRCGENRPACPKGRNQ